MNEIIDGLVQRFAPFIEALIQRILRFYNEKLVELTQLYEAQISRIRQETEHAGERLVMSGINAIGHGLWQIMIANLVISIIVGILLIVALFYYVRYKWRRWRWEPRMLQATLDQNELIRKSNQLAAEALKQRSVSPEP